MPDTFTFEEAVSTEPTSFTFEEATSFTFEDVSPTQPRDTLPPPVEFPPSPPEPSEEVAKELESFDPQATAIPGIRVPATPMESFIELPRASVPATLLGHKTPKALQAAAGLYNAAAGVTESVASPAVLASGALASAIPAVAPAVSGAWATEMARHVPEAAVDAYGSVVLEEPLQEQVEKIGNVAALGLGTVAAGTHAGRALVQASPTVKAFSAEPATPPTSPDVIARNLAAPGTMRPQEIRGAVSPIETAERPPEMVQSERVPLFNNAGEVVDVQVRQPRIREIVIEEGGESKIVPAFRGTVRESPEGGKVSFAAEAPTLLRNVQEPPKQGIISGTSLEAWADRTISESRGRVFTGLDPELAAAYLTKGIAIIERGARKFSDWSQRMISEYGDAVRPHLQSLFEQATRTMETLEADGRKMRSVSRRGTTSEQLPSEAREQLETDPASFYTRQRAKTVEDTVARMTNTELREPLDLTKQSNQQNWVARQLELSRRLMAEPATRQEGYALFQQLSESGTSFGQLVNQFKLLRNTTPDGLLEIVNRRLAEQNAPPLTPEQRIQLRVLGGRNMSDIAAWRRAEEAWTADPTAKNVDAVFNAKRAADESSRLFNERVQRIVPRGFWDTATAMSMGGKLSMMSQERNVMANIALMPMRAIARLPAAAIDMMDSLIRKKPREIALVPQTALAGAGRSAAQSAPTAARVLAKGDVSTGIGKTDTHVNLRPFVALKEIIAGELAKDKTIGQKAALLAEASPPAYFAAGMLRGLSGLDIPSREAARGRLIAEALKLEQINNQRRIRELKQTKDRAPEQDAELALLESQPKVDNVLVRQAVKVPELFLKPEVLDRVNRESLGAVFQDPNLFTRWVLGAEKLLPPAGRFLLRNVIPFVSLPVNWAGKLLGWSPVGFLTHVARHAAKGESREAKLAAGEAIIGSMTWLAANYLINKGLISPPLDSENEQQKMRLLAGDIMPPNHVNLSGLKRLFKGEDPSWKIGDETKDFTYYGSVVGAQMQMVSSAMRQMEKQPPPETDMGWWQDFIWNATQGAGSYLVNQTFMQGARDLLDAMKSDRKMETWLSGYSGALLDTAVPRQMEAINRAVSEYAREIKDDALDRRLNNVLTQRLGLFTKNEEELPFKRDVWGRPIRLTPEGSNPWLYQIFDVGKSRVIPDDPVKLEIYNLARRTGDLRAIPTPPDSSITIRNQTYKLDAQQLSRLQELVGQERSQLAEKVINARFLGSDDALKLAILARVWELGTSRGQVAFFRENRDTLKTKPKAAGFKQQ